MNLKHLTDQSLLADTKFNVARERQFSVKILHHFKEIERRRLFSDLGYGSLFEYATKELGYSEAAAARRIQSARLLAEVPELEKKIEEGVLSLTNLAMAAQLFKNEEIKETEKRKVILKEIEGTIKRECEKVLTQFAPPMELPPEKQMRITAEFHVVRMNWSDKTLKLFDEIKLKYSRKNLNQDQLCQFVFENELKESDANFSPPAERQSGTRHIPQALRRYILTRDKACVRCGSTFKLEIDHIQPFSMGGKTTKENLRVLCRSCNQRARIQASL